MDKSRKRDWRDSLTQEQQAQENAEAKLRMEQRRKTANIEEALYKFKQHIKEFAEYVCTCCNRMLYRKSVVEVRDKMFDVEERLRRMCLSRKTSADQNKWLCKTCQRYIKDLES